MSNTRKAAGAKATSADKAPPEAVDFATLLGEDTRPEKLVPLCLRGNLQAEWDRLKELYDAGPTADDKAMMVDRAAKRRVAEQLAEVEAKMRAGTVQFRLRALPRRRTPDTPKDQTVWQELVEKHPPRLDAKGKVDQRDAGAGVHMQPLLEELVPLSVVEPVMSAEQWQQLDAKLSDGQWQQLAMAAWLLNRSEVDVPFSRAASMMRSFDAVSRRQSDSASPSDDSTAGNPPPSPSTSTTSTEG